MIGLFCAVTNYAIMLGVDAAGGHYLIAMLAGFLVAIPLGFLLHSRFTFAEPLRWRSFARFFLAATSAYPLTVVVMVLLCSGFRLSVAIATPIATAVLFLWNFATAHWAILPRFDLRAALAGLPAKTDAAQTGRGAEE
ncbi:GtrA family protein [Sphingomonas sp. F9_3S_D5_B_2]